MRKAAVAFGYHIRPFKRIRDLLDLPFYDKTKSMLLTYEAYILSGASIYIITEKSGHGLPHQMKKKCEHEEVATLTILALGGKCVKSVKEATHALWIYPDEDDENGSATIKYGNNRHIKNVLKKCKLRNVPVVDTLWLEHVAGLMNGDHWSEIDVSDFEPAISKINNMGTTSRELVAINPSLSARRDDSSHLSSSINETYKSLADENPQILEDNAVRRAIELSMLDWAIVVSPDKTTTNHNGTNPQRKNVRLAPGIDPNSLSAYKLLGIQQASTQSEIKAAYRKLARETHPDKGGDATEFVRITRAYRFLLHDNDNHKIEEKKKHIKTTAHWDSELKDHHGLVNELFQNHSSDLEHNIEIQTRALEQLGLYHIDVGASNINEKNELIRNSCFYLSLATSYLAGIGALTPDFGIYVKSDYDDNDAFNNRGFVSIAESYHNSKQQNEKNKNKDDASSKEIDMKESLSTDQAIIGGTALDLKRIIEAAVVKAHPEWGVSGMVGEEVQAFSDFLVYVLDSPTILSDWAVVIFDTVSGFVDVYKGKHYPENDPNWAQSNTLTLRYVPGHYQPLLNITNTSNKISDGDDNNRPTLEKILQTLDDAGVLYVVTDGNA